MPSFDYSGVLIDGAVPRTGFERCDRLFDYLVIYCIETETPGPHSGLDPNVIEKEVHYGPDAHFWTEHEDELIERISEVLPDPYVCSLHDDDPGTVIVYDRTLA